MECINCGGIMVGDGYSVVLHCELVDVIGEYGCEPDADPIYCKNQEEEYNKNDR